MCGNVRSSQCKWEGVRVCVIGGFLLRIGGAGWRERENEQPEDSQVNFKNWWVIKWEVCGGFSRLENKRALPYITKQLDDYFLIGCRKVRNAESVFQLNLIPLSSEYDFLI